MYIDKFLKNHPKIKISKKTLMLCRVGEQKMADSIDQLHDNHHIGRLLSNLESFLKDNRNHKKINFEILLLSIIWHDTWKAKKQSLNPFKLLFHQIYEGFGSVIIFSKHSVGLLPKSIIVEVNYAIRKHAQFQFFPLNSIEAKILKDLDDLDLFHVRRLRPLIKKRNQVNYFTKIFGKYYINKLSSKKSLNNLQFSWTKKKTNKINKIVKKLLKTI
ncbi:MAG: hypothetical protein OEX81_01005 [Candidatus Pacebacteria bacterium]|nr:hypothetical protein [Candidatus Paceibacterota bacterium]